MREIKIQIPEEVVNRIQLKDFEAVSMQAVITNMLESHALDADTTIIDSPVFVGYQNRLVKVRKDFEEAKDAMLITYVDEVTRTAVTNWNLDYNSCTLTLQVKE
jgi:hypothetical protein